MNSVPYLINRKVKFQSTKAKNNLYPYITYYYMIILSYIIILYHYYNLVVTVGIKTNIIYVDISFTGNLSFGFGRYCGKVFTESAVSHPF